jgi:class 3 adenylate cyclase/tetratricopeptide (TPR) repeat protein
MPCPKCSHENAPEAKFCQNCGHALQRSCAKCGTTNAPNAKFCIECGSSLQQDSPAVPKPAPVSEPNTFSTQLELQKYIPKELFSRLKTAKADREMMGERRIVTMLFCDVIGSTEAAESLDPEEWAEIINGAFEHMIQGVYSYEGTIARLMGDGILAFFGAPIAHEDDPERAVMAGLEIIENMQAYRTQVKEQWQLEIDVRVGINTGLVVVGAVGSDLRMEYTALGDAINLAARMEQTAQPNTVQIADATYKLVARLFHFEALGSVTVKGKADPIPAYRVESRQDRPDRQRGIVGLESPLVGRDLELQTLHRSLAELHSGRGQIVSIIAEAGLGKSRLVAELRKNSKLATEMNLTWREGRSLSYETATPYAPFIHWFHDCFELQVTQNDAEKYARIHSQIEAVSPGHGSSIAPFIATMLSIQPSEADYDRIRYLKPAQLRSGIFEAILHYSEHLAELTPTVVVFDDVHWIDPTSLELLEALLPVANRTQLMIVAVYRPRRQEPFWRFHETAEREFPHRYHAVHLHPLDESSSRELVSNLLEVDQLPEHVRQLILQKAEGNPFFVEEVIRSMLDADLIVRENGRWRASKEISNISVPDNLAAVITTRIDRLEEGARHILQAASVIGREFELPVLEKILTLETTQTAITAALTEMQRRELIRETARIPARKYKFKHALTQETTYNSLLLKKRRELHRITAECLLTERPEHPEDIARHFLAARLPGLALPYLLAAGEYAKDVYAAAEARSFFEQAIDILDDDSEPALVRRAYEGLAAALAASYDFPAAASTYETLLEKGQDLNNVQMQVSARNKLGSTMGFNLMQFEQGQDHVETGLALAGEVEDTDGMFEGQMLMCQFCMSQGDFDGALDQFASALEIGERVNNDEARLFGLSHTAGTLTRLLKFEQALTIIEQAWELATAVGHRKYQAEVQVNCLGVYHLFRGEYGAAREALEFGKAIAAEINDYQMHSQAYIMLAQLADFEGDYEDALQCFTQGVELATIAQQPWMLTWGNYGRGEMLMRLSAAYADQGREHVQSANDLVESMNGLPVLAGTWLLDGFIHLLNEDPAGAEARFETGITKFSAETNLYLPMQQAGKALALTAQGRQNKTGTLLDAAVTGATDAGLNFALPFVYRVRADIALARGNLTQAQADYEQALAITSQMTARVERYKAHAGLARVFEQQGEPVDAAEQQQWADDLLTEIQGRFKDEAMGARLAETLRSLSYADATDP